MGKLNLVIKALADHIDRGEVIPIETNPIALVGLFTHLTKRGMSDHDASRLIFRHCPKFETPEAFEAEIDRVQQMLSTLVLEQR